MKLSYLAGLLDGEGSIMLLGQGPNRSRRPQITVAIMERFVLKEISACFGGFISQARGAAVPAWRLNGFPALELLRALRPFLVIQRRAALADFLLQDTVICDTTRKGVLGSKISHNEAVFQQMRTRNDLRLDSIPVFEHETPSDNDIAYMAGILDGEGWISFKHRKIEVNSTDPELPAWIESRFGGRASAAREASGNQRKMWRWGRSATGCGWANDVANEMRLARKAAELRQMQGFTRTASPPAPLVEDTRSRLFSKMRAEGFNVAVSAREAGLTPYEGARWNAKLQECQSTSQQSSFGR